MTKKFLLWSAGVLFLAGCSNLPVPEQPEGKHIPINTDIVLSQNVLPDSGKKEVPVEDKSDRTVIPSIKTIDRTDARFSQFRKPHQQPQAWPKAKPAQPEPKADGPQQPAETQNQNSQKPEAKQ
ncbi:MAG: hypothetical protein II152_07265 [Succinivibrionaceae bacterium]|nr:hypothetical protein [Succinivibrionaceae bacterium]